MIDGLRRKLNQAGSKAEGFADDLDLDDQVNQVEPVYKFRFR